MLGSIEYSVVGYVRLVVADRQYLHAGINESKINILKLLYASFDVADCVSKVSFGSSVPIHDATIYKYLIVGIVRKKVVNRQLLHGSNEKANFNIVMKLL